MTRIPVTAHSCVIICLLFPSASNKIAAMQSGNSTQAVNNGLLLGDFTQVFSFDMASEFIDEKVVTSDPAGTISSGLFHVYATKEFLATISIGSSYNTTTSAWDYRSFVLGFDISGDTTSPPRPFCFAEVPGIASSSAYSTDVYKGHLRVSTTEYFWSETNDNTTMTTTISILKVLQSQPGVTTQQVIDALVAKLTAP